MDGAKEEPGQQTRGAKYTTMNRVSLKRRKLGLGHKRAQPQPPCKWRARGEKGVAGGEEDA